MSMFLVDRMGRKVLLIISTSGSALSIFALGTFFYIDENKCLKSLPNEECTDGFSPDLIESLKWMPVVSTITIANRVLARIFKNVTFRLQQCCISCSS